VTQLVLHIGPHKTGTTYIQQNLYELAPLLAERGVCYPTDKWIFHFGHHDLIDREMVGSLRQDLAACVPADATTVVLSTENFDRLEEPAIRLLREQVDDPVRIVFYLRRADALLYSTWQEDVKFGSEESFPRFLLRHLAKPFSSELINPALVLDRWASVFGLDSIRIFDYDHLVETGVDLCKSFLQEVLGVEGLDPSTTTLINKSLARADAELLRALNSIDRSRGHPPGDDLREEFLAQDEAGGEFSQLAERPRKAIQDAMEYLDLGALGLVKAIREQFREKYQRCIADGPNKDGQISLRLPSERWLLHPRVAADCFHLHTLLRHKMSVFTPLSTF
jgi:hypothetical protein